MTKMTNKQKHYAIRFSGFLRYGGGVLWEIFRQLEIIKEQNDIGLFIHSVYTVGDNDNDKDIVLHLMNATEDDLDIVINYLTNDSDDHYKKYGDCTPFLVIDKVKVTQIK
jgi:hypothetical protein